MEPIGQQSYDYPNDNNRERRSWFKQKLEKDEWEEMKVKKSQDEQSVGADKSKDDYDTYKWKLSQLWKKGKGEVTLVRTISREDIQKALSRQNLESKLPNQNNTFFTVKDNFKGSAYSFLPGEFERAGLDPQKLRIALEANGVKGGVKEKIAFKWLNELLATGIDDTGSPLPYNFDQETPEIREAKAAYYAELALPKSEGRISLVVPKRIKLNCEILQATYSKELCPQRSTSDEVVIDAFFTPDSLDLLIKDPILWQQQAIRL